MPSAISYLTNEDLVSDAALGRRGADLLDHLPIANTVADLVASCDPPANIVMFGPWGSGKSSFAGLLESSLASRHPGLVHEVVYNAWTFGGESLQRNFISHAASDLKAQHLLSDAEAEAVQERLYERSRNAKFRMSNIDWKRLLLVAAGFWVAIVVAVLILTFLLAWVFGNDPWVQLRATLPTITTSSGVTSLILAFAAILVAGARVDIDQTVPTEEQLRTTFRDLVVRKALGASHARLLFYVDELDRCEKDEVRRTLGAVRSFFDVEGCVFIVAADREVLERALDDPNVVTPIDVVNPYYSSASEFFDKVFQYQLALPPLRGGRLTKFAEGLVLARTAGVWGELRAAGGDELVRQVVADLVPSHVRSPRRVKILLNAFATTVRVVESAGIPWTSRAREIAKLTAMRTEFPRLAPDLLVEPRLPSLLLDPPDDASPRLEALLTRHALPTVQAGTGRIEDPGEEPEATDSIRVPGETDEEGELKRSQRRLLRRYLVRVANAPDPGRDLLYLSKAGDTVDLADPGLGQELEDIAADDPGGAAALVAGQPVAERQKAVRLLAAEATEASGPERITVARSMMAVAQGLDFALGEAAYDAVRLLYLVKKDEGVPDDLMLPALVIAEAVDGSFGKHLADDVLADPRFLDGPARIRDATLASPHFTEPRRAQVWAQVPAAIASDLDVITRPLKDLPLPMALGLLAHCGKALVDEAQARVSSDPDQAAAMLSALDGVADSRSEGSDELRAALARVFVDAVIPDLYSAVSPLVAKALPAASATDGLHLRLAVLRVAPPDDWEKWSTGLDASVADDAEAITAAAASRAVLEGSAAAGNHGRLRATLSALVPVIRAGDASATWAEVEPAWTGALGRNWVADGTAAAQKDLHVAAVEMAAIGGPWSALHDMVAEDISATLGMAVLARATPTVPAGASPGLAPGLDALSAVIDSLDEGACRELSAAVRVAPGRPADVAGCVRAEVAIMRRRLALGSAATLDSLPALAEVEAIAAADPAFIDAWLSASPPLADVVTLSGKYPKFTYRDGARAWGTQSTPGKRTDLVLALVAEDVALARRWAEVLGELPGGFDELPLVEGVFARIDAASNRDQRADLTRVIIAAAPSTEDGKNAMERVAVRLLGLGTNADEKSAMSIVPLLAGSRVRRSGLKAAVERSVSGGMKLGSRGVATLSAAGVDLSRSVRDRLIGMTKR